MNVLNTYWKYLSPTAILLMAYVQTQFVARDEFKTYAEKIGARVEKIEQILIRMESSAETDKRHDTNLNDHESRLRAIENKIR